MSREPQMYQVADELKNLATTLGEAAKRFKGIAPHLDEAGASAAQAGRAVERVPALPADEKRRFLEQQVEKPLVDARDRLCHAMQASHESFRKPDQFAVMNGLSPDEQQLLRRFDSVIATVRDFVERFT